ncbi:hypothetical protein DFP74_5347 [Nocardiopsis sp. Huas11]|uniref:hypothetical protein n=1 Tax=Nocardiopsis sp. Huas11 TaxID=2183912 RepID=UPI000EB08E65|nr:hypothetical protein [Nocardiopsis sp. Huas11]RKS09605.1 hypothetical protein DFP74_5347 [Nocardiopsis sp. Huas11]
MEPRTSDRAAGVLVLGGCSYAMALFAITVVVPIMAVLSLMMGPGPYPWGAYLMWTLFALAVATPLGLWLTHRAREAGVVRPFATVGALTAVVAVSYAQTAVTTSLLGSHFSAMPVGAVFAAGTGTVIAVVVLYWSGGRGFPWVLVGLVLACAARVALDQSVHEAHRRARFDETVATVAKYPHDVLLLDDGRWSAVGVSASEESFSVDYAGAGGDEMKVDAWIDFANDGVRGTSADPFWHGCHGLVVHCSETEVDGRRVLLIRDARYHKHHARVRWNSFTYVDVEPDPLLWTPVTGHELLGLVDALHPADGDGAETLAEQIIGGPRP